MARGLGDVAGEVTACRAVVVRAEPPVYDPGGAVLLADRVAVEATDLLPPRSPTRRMAIRLRALSRGAREPCRRRIGLRPSGTE
ncbi:MAG: hypothetical protein ACRDQU_01375 [Pseudonocardiaceae bacterium]